MRLSLKVSEISTFIHPLQQSAPVTGLLLTVIRLDGYINSRRYESTL